MAKQFNSLEECLAFIEQMKGFGIVPSPELLAEKARLEDAENVNPAEYIYGTFAAHNKFMTAEKDAVVREMTDELLTDGENATQPCLLMGKVQCGKTDTFISIVSLCFDRGIDIAVVLTKPTTTLSNQTISRLNHKDKGLGRFKDNKTYNQKAIITVYDVLDLYHRGGLSDNQMQDPARKFIIVCKKEHTNLEYLNKMFEQNAMMRAKKVLICDDEADFASRAYYVRKGEMNLARISELIENFTKVPDYCRYLQITATPSSLYLQPDGTVQLRDGKEASPWLPRYTGLVPIHGKYIGGKQYYVDSENEDSMYSMLFEPVDQECMDVLSARDDFYADSVYSETMSDLVYAVVLYLFSAAVRSIQEEKTTGKRYQSSCLIHCEVRKDRHQWQADLIENIITTVKNAFIHKGNSDLRVLDFESLAYDSLKKSNELGRKEGLIKVKFPSFTEIESKVKRILEENDYTIETVNSEEAGKVETLIDNDPESPQYGQLRLDQTLNFFIGGSILDRGITIGNMLCFFYGRNPGKFQMDTVLQHARMYGARDKEDMACTRFFTTFAIYDVLKTINQQDEMMYDYLKAHRGTVQTNDFTSMVLGYDKRVAPSAQNKYTPANTKLLKCGQRTYPVGFQTLEQDKCRIIMDQINDIIDSAKEKNAPDENGVFLLSYEDAVSVIHLIRTMHVYQEEWNNVGLEWDINDMIVPLEFLTYDTDGMIYCKVRSEYNMSRERENIYDKRGRFIDAPESGSEVREDREIAIDRPLLVLRPILGSADKGWRDASFYWPTLTYPQEMNEGIYTLNNKKKAKKVKPEVVLDTIGNYPEEEVLRLSVNKNEFFSILLGEEESYIKRDIRLNSANMYLEKDLFGNFILIDSCDPEKHYDLSSYNNGIFPWEVRKYKYLHLVCGMGNTGSQAIVSLDEDLPIETFSTPRERVDTRFDEHNRTREDTDYDYADWRIFYNIGMVLDSKLTKEDQEMFDQILLDLQAEEEEENNNTTE